MEEYVLTPHAKFEMERRGLSEETIREVLGNPGQRYNLRPGRDVFQSKITDTSTGESFLVRVFVDMDRIPPEVVTVYKTSKIGKYWRS